MKHSLAILLITLSLASCDNLQPILDEANRTLNTTPTDLEINSGLKEALIQGTNEGVDNLSKAGGYLNNPKVKIPFPENAEKVRTTLIDLGLKNQVDQVVTSINHAAEDAVKEASPLFVSAIRQMSINDVRDILFGADNAATNYLRSKTAKELKNKFQPDIEQSLTKVNATKYWTDVIQTYNKVPFVEKVNPDLSAYVTEMTINGLFIKIQEEEMAIRENPAERTSEILRKVFGYADTKQ